MAKIKFQNVDLDFPVFNATTRSLKNKLMEVATGGHIKKNQGTITVKALEDLSFEMNDGDRVGIIGHNGSGKTTLLRALSGVYAPTSGSAQIIGEIGSMINISLGIEPEATGIQNIYIRGSLLGMRRKEMDKYIEDISEFAGLGDFLEMPTRTYSTGMTLRLAFAIATVTRPEILLMDEWLSVGDKEFNEKAQKRLNDVIDTSSIMVIASHSKDLIQQTCNRVLWLEHGKIKMDGSLDEVLPAYFG